MRSFAMGLLAAALCLSAFAGGRSQAGKTPGKTSGKRPAARETSPAPEKPKYRTVSLRGKVVWTADAMKRLFGVETDADAAHNSVSLETDDGRLYPIVKDARGRGFWKDPRIRDIDMELMVRQYDGSPWIQVIRVFVFKEGKKYQMDYWCDICAIPMFELKDCECCQGPIRIRLRPVQ